MKWNLRLAAAERGIWKASELQRMLAEAGPLITQQTATETGPVSNVWARKPLRGHTATLERLRQDGVQGATGAKTTPGAPLRW